jgi:hypothetical protein
MARPYGTMKTWTFMYVHPIMGHEEDACNIQSINTNDESYNTFVLSRCIARKHTWSMEEEQRAWKTI